MRIWRWLKKFFRPEKKPVNRAPVVISGEYREDWLSYALEEVTGTFEGTGYGQITGNFDGQGLSAGILQWNYGQLSLQEKILIPAFNTLGRNIFKRHFKEMADKVIESKDFTASQGIRFAKKEMSKSFRESFKNFMLDPHIVKIQKQASANVANKAWGYCKEWGFSSKRSFCFFFDVVTQNGSMRGQKPPIALDDFNWSISSDGGINKQLWLNIQPTQEQEVLWQSIRNRVTRNMWASDVLARKGTIIFGRGVVHGSTRAFDFEK